jgi:O-antigen/teichoic acid export membrane protein
MLKAFLKDSAIYAIPTFVSRGLSLFLVPLYTRVLNPSDYGALDLFMVFGSLVNLTVALEVSQGVARSYADAKDPGERVTYASTAWWFTVGCYTAFALVCLVFAKPIASKVMGGEGFTGFFALGLAYLWLNGLFYLIQNQLRWELRSGQYAVVSMLSALVTAAVSVCLAYFLRWGLFGILWGMISGALAANAFGLYRLRRSFRFRFGGRHLKEMLTFSAPLVPSGVAVFVGLYIDRIMINKYLSLREVGLYGMGYRLASAVSLVMVGFQGALLPLVYTNYRNPETPGQLAAIFRMFLAFALATFLGLTLFAPEILALVTTPPYYPAAKTVIFLVPAVLLSSMYIFAVGIGISKKNHILLWTNIAGAALNTLLCVLLIPRYGITGAAAATFLGYGSVFAVYMAFSQRLYPVPHRWGRLTAAAAAAAALAFCIPRLPLSPAWAIAAKAVALATACVAFVALGLVHVGELRRVAGRIGMRFAKPGAR